MNKMKIFSNTVFMSASLFLATLNSMAMEESNWESNPSLLARFSQRIDNDFIDFGPEAFPLTMATHPLCPMDPRQAAVWKILSEGDPKKIDQLLQAEAQRLGGDPNLFKRLDNAQTKEVCQIILELAQNPQKVLTLFCAYIEIIPHASTKQIHCLMQVLVEQMKNGLLSKEQHLGHAEAIVGHHKSCGASLAEKQQAISMVLEKVQDPTIAVLERKKLIKQILGMPGATAYQKDIAGRIMQSFRDS